MRNAPSGLISSLLWLEKGHPFQLLPLLLCELPFISHWPQRWQLRFNLLFYTQKQLLSPSPIIWGNLVQFNCWSVYKEELGRKLNCFPGWAFKVQILGSANSLWDCGKFLPKYSSQSIMKSFPAFSLGSSQILFPVRSWLCTWWVPSKLGCLQLCWRCSWLVGPPTPQPWPPRDPPGVQERHSLPMRLWGKPPSHATAQEKPEFVITAHPSKEFLSWAWLLLPMEKAFGEAENITAESSEVQVMFLILYRKS